MLLSRSTYKIPGKEEADGHFQYCVMDGVDKCVTRNTIQEFCMYEKKVLQSCYQKSKSKHIFLRKELIACGSKGSRFWVEEMLDQEKNLVEQILLPGG